MRLIKHKWKIILCLLFVLIATCALAACTYTYDPADDGFTVTVIYDANGGRFGSSDGTSQREFKYKPAVSIIEPGGKQSSQISAPVLTSKHVSGWYSAVLDENGNPIKNSDGEFVDEEGVSIFEGEAWNFDEDKLPEEDNYKLYLVARWVMNFKLTVDVGQEARDAGLKNVEYTSYTEAGPLSRPYLEARDYQWADHTLYSCITEDGRELISSEDWATLEFSDEVTDITVTVRWLEGEWNIVQTADNLRNIKAAENYILANDINMNGAALNITNYRGIFDGNGFTIFNFKNTGTTLTSSSTEWGAFSFYMGGYMKNVTFKDCSYSVTLTRAIPGEDGYYAVGFLAGNGGKSTNFAEFKNIGFTNCSVNITKMGNAAEETIVTGADSYFGIFGTIPTGQSFVPAEGSQPITVSIN